MSNKKTGLLASGSVLAEQREKLGLSVEECAESLKLSCTKIRALEAGDESPFISDVFVRGHIKSYAKLVQLPEDDVLYYYDATDTNPAATEYAQSHSENKQSKWWLPYCVGFVLIAGWFIVSSYLDKDSQWLNNLFGYSTTSEIVNPPLLVLDTSQKVNNLPSSDISLEDQVDEKISVSKVDSDVSFNNTNIDQETLKNISVKKIENNILQESIEDVQSSSVNTVEGDVADTITEAQEPTIQEVVSDPLVSSVSSISRLEFTFKEECWVQVVDANESIIESSLREANTSLVVTGEAPFAVILGNIVGTTMQFNGELIPLRNASGSKTLRITVGS